jgi:hypothetical protein
LTCPWAAGNFLLTETVDWRYKMGGAEVAQSVEQWTENPRVDGSIPSLGTNDFKWLGK